MVVAFCSNCGSDLYEMDAPFESGDLVEASRVRALPDVPQPKPGEASTCPRCGTNLIPTTASRSAFGPLTFLAGSMEFRQS